MTSTLLEELSNSQDAYILFVDMCDSTEFKQYCFQNEMPDSVWILRQLMFLERCSTIIKSYHGDIIKTIGDEVMATFYPTVDPISIIRCLINNSLISDAADLYYLKSEDVETVGRKILTYEKNN